KDRPVSLQSRASSKVRQSITFAVFASANRAIVPHQSGSAPYDRNLAVCTLLGDNRVLTRSLALFPVTAPSSRRCPGSVVFNHLLRSARGRAGASISFLSSWIP